MAILHPQCSIWLLRAAQTCAILSSPLLCCRDLYECSCSELDEVIRQAKEYGALGSRLTGAGWGGCTVSLIRQDQAAGFISKLKDNYFAQCIKDGKVAEDGLDDVVFDSRPSSGGAVLKLKL